MARVTAADPRPMQAQPHEDNHWPRLVQRAPTMASLEQQHLQPSTANTCLLLRVSAQ